MKKCILCNSALESNQKIVLSNEQCQFLQLEQANIKGSLLEGAGIIIPKKHRETAFDLSQKEWEATHSLLQEVKLYIDNKHHPQGYNLGWNCGKVAGQHILHAHLHIIPRYNDEPYAGKGIRYLFKSRENLRKND